MAVNEKNVLLRSKESNGDTNIIYPITTLDNVDGFEEFQEQLNVAYKTVVRSVNGVTPDDSGNVVADLCVTILDLTSADISMSVNGNERTFTVPASLVSHTYDEIVDAINNGLHVFIVANGYVLQACSYSSGSVGFQTVNYYSEEVVWARVWSDNSLTGWIVPATLCPVQINTWEADD